MHAFLIDLCFSLEHQAGDDRMLTGSEFDTGLITFLSLANNLLEKPFRVLALGLKGT